MNAIEFVKRFGLDEAKKFTGLYGGDTAFKFLKVKEKTISVHSGDQPYDFHINDLKQIVDAFDRVMEHGSVELAKKYAESKYTAPEVKEFLSKAINLVEKCQ